MDLCLLILVAHLTYISSTKDNYKAKYPTTKDLEKAGIVDPENSKFDGAGIDLFWLLDSDGSCMYSDFRMPHHG
ncbi:MAG: hypothetical protein ACLUGQ_08385 [Coprococcus sp.]